MVTLVLALAAASAQAGEEACRACCRAAGLASCEPELRVFGEGSRLARDSGAWDISGVWRVGCDGVGFFDPLLTTTIDHAPLGGELVMDVLHPLQVHCFRQACGLPVGTCVSPPDDEGRFYLLECGTGLPVDAATLASGPRTAPRGAAAVVVIDGRPLVVSAEDTAPAAAPSPATSGPVTSWSAPAGPASPATSGPVTSWSSPAPPPAPDPALAASPPAPSGASVASAPGDSPDPYTTFATSLPRDPPENCTPPAEALRGEARRRVERGDERRIGKDYPGALAEYRAALTLDACSPYGWFGIGEIASEAARPDLTVRALRNATRLLPGHYGAWTLLGKAYEALRQSTLAAEAYGEALALRPNLPEALAGWRRTATPASP